MKWLMELWGLSEYNQWEIHWTPAHADWILAGLGIMVPLALWFFWTSLRRIRSYLKKSFLLLVRLAAFALVALLLLQPELEFHESHSLKNSIAVLLDNSKSMSIKTFPSEKQRIEWVRQAVAANRPYLKGLETDFNVDYFLMSDRIETLAGAEGLEGYRPRAGNTQLGKAFSELAAYYQDKSLKGILLFSDGADLTQEPEEISRDFLETLTGFSAPVHAFQAGSNEAFKDLAIESLDAAEFGFIQQPIRVAVSLRSSGMGNKNVPLVLKEGSNILVSKVVELKKDRGEYRAELEFTPRELGKQVYSVSVPLFAGESIQSNNLRYFQVKVIRDRIRILHLNGRPSWDSRFLREVLVNNPKVDLLSFFILRTLGTMWRRRPRSSA